MKHFVIEMENGATMSGELYEDIAPKSVENFVELCEICHVYDNSVFPNLLFRKHKLSETFYPSGVWTSELLYQLIGNPEEL